MCYLVRFLLKIMAAGIFAAELSDMVLVKTMQPSTISAQPQISFSVFKHAGDQINSRTIVLLPVQVSVVLRHSKARKGLYELHFSTALPFCYGHLFFTPRPGLTARPGVVGLVRIVTAKSFRSAKPKCSGSVFENRPGI